MQVRKANGDLVPFEIEKLLDSLRQAGAEDALAKTIADAVAEKLVEGISTRKIYQRAFALLKKKSTHVAGQYQLKQAVLDLGPSGYPFEVFMGHIFQRMGYAHKISQTVQGHCITHEIDVLLERDGKSEIMECKFRNRDSDKVDAKTALYIYARFLDVQEGTQNWKAPVHKVWIATNARFSQDAITFAQCRGMELIGWDFPAGKSVRDYIRSFQLHPITSLKTIKRKELEKLLAREMVLVRELVDAPEILQEILSQSDQKRIPKIMKEAYALLKK